MQLSINIAATQTMAKYLGQNVSVPGSVDTKPDVNCGIAPCSST